MLDGECSAPSWSTPHPPSLRSGTFSHTGRRGRPAGEKGNRFTAAGNHHRSRLTEALIWRLSFSPCGRRWPSRSEAQARPDEGCWPERGAPSWNTPSSVPHSSKGMKKTKFLYPPPFSLSHNLRHRLHGNLVRTGYQGGRRCRAGRVAETRLEIFIRGPGPLRGSPAPAEATAGAPTIGQDHRRGAGKAPNIYFTRCRPSAPLPDCLNSQTEKSGRGNGETCAQYSPHRDRSSILFRRRSSLCRNEQICEVASSKRSTSKRTAICPTQSTSASPPRQPRSPVASGGYRP